MTRSVWRTGFASRHAREIRSRRFAPIPSTNSNSPGRVSMKFKTSALNRPTSLFAITGPMPLTKPLLRYRSIPSTAVGSTVRMVLALNCSPCSLSLTHQPPPASTRGGITQRTEPPPKKRGKLSREAGPAQKNVTRSITPDSWAVGALRSGAEVFIWTESF
jgi:hypothetical protein